MEKLKASKEMLEWCRDKKVLVFHPQKVVRSTIARGIGEFGIGQNVIDLEQGDFEHFKTLMSEKKYDIVFCDTTSIETPIFEFIREHEQAVPYRLDSLFICLTDDNSGAAAQIKLDYYIDGMITCPLTALGLNNAIIRMLEKKTNPSEDSVLFEKAREDFNKGDIDLCLAKMHKNLTKMKKPSQTYAFIGDMHLIDGNVREAIEAFEKGKEIDSEDYKILSGLERAYVQQKDYHKAFDAFMSLLNKYPLSLEKIPDLIRTCVATEHFDEIIGLIKLFKQSHITSKSHLRYLSAGLIMAGKALYKTGKPDLAKNTIYEALKYDGGSFIILNNVCTILAMNEESKLAYDLLEKFSEDSISDDEFASIEINIHYFSGDYNAVMRVGNKLLDSKTGKVDALMKVIESGKRLDLSEKALSDIISKASKVHPDEQANFTALLF
jgi:tetratricopeptide (TPR) repeat protein